jgi:diguanylate cyclase (GGDEF)-like protein
LSIAAQAVFETTTPDLGGRHLLAWVYSVAVLLALFLLDALLPTQIHISVLYLFPILLVTWNVGKRSGIAMAALAAVASGVADRINGTTYPHLWIPVVEIGLRTILFTVFALIISELRRALSAEKELSRLDPLTGVANRRSFVEHTAAEILRAARYHRPLTIAYVDIDGFKAINDERGHQTGDDLLKLVATTLHAHVRRTDAVARLGGDEFAISLAETDADAARATCENFRDTLLDVVRAKGYAVTFSVGVVTFVKAPTTVDDLIQRADVLMYSVKRNGKNQLAHEVVTA